MKKIILSFTVFVVIIYLLLCYGINKWIDNQETGDDLFRVEQDTTNLDIAKLIWQITPAFDKEKDAERALKISQLYIASLSVYSYNEKMIKSLKNNYHFISIYQNKIPKNLENKFILQKMVIINRSYGEIKDKELEDFLSNTTYKANLNNSMKTFRFSIENSWFNYLNNKQDKLYWLMSKRILQEISEEQNNATLLILDDYHSALRLCYDKHLSKENAEEHNIESQKIFQQMQEKLLHNMQEFQVLNDYLKEENSMALMLVPLISSNKTECEKEAQNFADNMRKINTVLAVDEIMKKY